MKEVTFHISARAERHAGWCPCRFRYAIDHGTSRSPNGSACGKSRAKVLVDPHRLLR